MRRLAWSPIRLRSIGFWETGQIVRRVDPAPERPTFTVQDAVTGELETWRADHVIVATPQFVTRRLVDGGAERNRARAAFRYSPWVVANLYLEESGRCVTSLSVIGAGSFSRFTFFSGCLLFGHFSS